MRAKIVLPNKEMLDNYSDMEYLYYVIAFHTAPTIMRKKAASLVVLRNGNRKLRDIWMDNREKCDAFFPLDSFVITKKEDSITVLFYQADLLEQCLNKEENRDYLRSFGYPAESGLYEKLEYLSVRFQSHCPHEVGIFLDYPLHDVKAFTECRHERCLLTGYWRVYAKESDAEKRFQEFDRSKKHILQFLLDGVSPKRLAFPC